MIPRVINPKFGIYRTDIPLNTHKGSPSCSHYHVAQEPLTGSHGGLDHSLKIGLPVRISIDLGATIQRRPLGLFLEEPHRLDILVTNNQPNQNVT